MTSQVFPAITIITPSFNQAAFLEETITSVLEQNYPNLQYIIVDGGSTDGSVDIIRKYAGALDYWVSEKDRGQSHALNKGLQRASGDLIAYINSDDYYLPDTFNAIATCFIAHPEVDLLHGRCRFVDEKGERIGGRFGNISDYAEMLDLWDVWWKERNFVQPEVFWTKRVSDQIGLFREDLHWVMDYEYWARIFRAGGKARRVDAEIACFRFQANQKSTQPRRTADELLQVVEPLIWEKPTRLSWSQQRELKGKWIFDVLFRREAERSHSSRQRFLHWLNMIVFSLRNPPLLFTKALYQRAWQSARRQ